MRNLRIFFCLLLLCCSWPLQAVAAATPVVRLVRVAGIINPVTADFLTAQLEQAASEQAAAVLLELDTPGGLDTAMRRIIQAMFGSSRPVIVYVAPAGARAASAGALITLAADFAAMAPGTNLGAAHPVSIGWFGGETEGKDSVMQDKVVNDAVAYARSLAQQRGRNPDWAERMVRESISTSATEALQLKVIDLVAGSRVELLEQLDGRSFEREGGKEVLHCAGASLVEGTMSLRQQVLDAISNPNVAYLLLMLGILGIFFEISQPGVILPGAIGALALLLAFLGFQTLPVNYVGVLLILLALVLFLLEIKVVSYGMLTVGGIITLALGSLVLIDSPLPYLQISRMIIAVTVLSCGGVLALVLFFVVRTQQTRFVSGVEGLVGERGEAVTAIGDSGQVFVHGEYWKARARVPLPAGAAVEVVAVLANLVLEVRAAAGGPPPASRSAATLPEGDT